MSELGGLLAGLDHRRYGFWIDALQQWFKWRQLVSHKRRIEQGLEMGRPSTISLSIELERGKLSSVRIGGHAVRVSEGRIQV